jgi:hypothetical protein
LRRDVSKNHRTIAAHLSAKLNIHLEDTLSTKTARCELHKPNIHSRAATAKPLISEVMLRCINDGITTIKPGHQTTGNVCVRWSDKLSFTLFPTSGRVYAWRTPKGAYNLKCLVTTVKLREGGSVTVWAANIVVFCWSHYYLSWRNYCKEVCG